MQPFYFNSVSGQLFGIYHSAQSNKIQESSVLLCAPIGHEYIYSHRAMRQLAILLSRSGFNVLRFDYTGCGDSLGDEESWDINQWIEDIMSAADKLRDISKSNKIMLIGYRLGASLVFLGSQKVNNLQKMVLWDPVISGIDYFNDIRLMHSEWLKSTFSNIKMENEKETEIQGFLYNSKFLDQLTELSLETESSAEVEKILILQKNNDQRCTSFYKHISSNNSNAELQSILETPELSQSGGMYKVTVPSRTINLILKWMRNL